MDFIPPHSAMFNASYNEPPFTQNIVRVAFQSSLQILAQVLGVNAKGSGAHFADDMLVWFRNLGFTEDADFCRAMEPYIEDKILRARIWRVYSLCWAAKSCLNLPGHFVDIGAYDGKTVDVVRRFIRYENVEKDWVLYDLFDYHPTEKSKVNHGPELYSKVCQMFADNPRIKVVKGFLPQSMEGTLPDQIAFAQIDLNSAAVEIDCLKMVLERMTPGGIIVLDDYGFKRYKESYTTQKQLAESKGQLIFESPTGQGYLIKR